MNVDRVKLWIEALRSGEFQQGQRKLFKDGKYCCLGVACVVAQREGGIQTLPWERALNQFGSSNGFWPYDVQRWFGYNAADGINLTPNTGEWTTPVGANDDLGWTFDRIADALESLIQQNGDNV